MAFSQVQCLDDSHVNWRSSEAKPEFFYSEEQRLALEALLSQGPEAFYRVLQKENIRDFLSEPELKKILDSLETYDPGAEDPRRHGEERLELGEAGPAPSLEYWPEKSDRSVPQLDLGWPETVAYRGVTRATVYMQPPIDCQPHIKEVVRKMVSQAQKVVAVVMDMFTDVDIFKDLLDAGFKRKVAIYIIVDESNLKYFLQMCERAQMHTGHLKNLRVRATGGTEFFTRSATRFKGALAQKFMFVDGDKAMCGSYSFTWSAARTDRNVISVLSGQVVEAFDKEFQELYLMSRGVSLKSVPMEDEPEPEPLALPTVMPLNPTSDNTVVKKMFNPKYALVKAKSAEQIVNGKAASSDKNAAKNTEAKNGAIPEGRVSERPNSTMDLAPQIHPGLLNLEKANMFDYLPTWVEPDPEPGSEILGYINIIDPKIKNIQLSQMNRIKVCDVSQANAQHRQMLKQKAQEAKRSRGGHPPEPPQPNGPSSPAAPNQEVPTRLTNDAVEKNAGAPMNGESLANGQNSNGPSPDQADCDNEAPPVPKPRTVPVTELLSTKSPPEESVKGEGHPTQPPESDRTNTVADSGGGGGAATQVSGNCRQLSRQEAVSEEVTVNGVEGDEGEEEEEEDYAVFSGQESLSGSSANLLHSTTSSTSEEYFEARDHSGLLRRTNSDFLLNGDPHRPRPPLQRKLSEPHVSRGTFVSPLGSPQPPLLNLALEEARQRRRKSGGVEELRCVLGKGRNLQALPDGYDTCPSNAPQVLQLFCYGSRVQMSPGRGQNGKSPEAHPLRRDGSRAKNFAGQPYWQSPAFSSSTKAPQTPPASSRGRGAGTAGGPYNESQRPPQEIKTPLGVPLSRLSQSKHLKNKAGQWSGAKRRPSGGHGGASRTDQ